MKQGAINSTTPPISRKRLKNHWKAKKLFSDNYLALFLSRLARQVHLFYW
ncbi:MAG: hypothetical protein VB857_16975 [Pirellulaceae bacterium]